jgi:hypothetical protein
VGGAARLLDGAVAEDFADFAVQPWCVIPGVMAHHLPSSGSRMNRAHFIEYEEELGQAGLFNR